VAQLDGSHAGSVRLVNTAPTSDLERRIRQLAADAIGIGVQSVRSVERIEHGLTNDSWIVRAPRLAVVVRLNSASSSELQIDRTSERRILEVVSQAGLGPRVLVCDPEAGVLVTELLSGSPWSLEYARTTVGIARLANLLRELHALSIADGIGRVDLSRVIEGYWTTLQAAGRTITPDVIAKHEQARATTAMLKADMRARLCHNDVHHLNLMDDGRLRLLDWEYAGLGDPFFDLAGVCCYHAYTPEQREQLLQHYLGRPDQPASTRLAAACWLFDYIRELWVAVRDVGRQVGVTTKIT
jgi:thiamine kinase